VTSIRRDHLIKKIGTILLCGCCILTACQPNIANQQTVVARETQQTALTITPPVQITPTSTPPAYLQIDPKSLQGVTIEFWHPWAGDESTEIAALVAEYNRTNLWGIRVVVKAQGGAQILDDAVQNSIANDHFPNLVAASTVSLMAWQQQKDLLVDLNPYLQDAQWGMSAGEIAEIPQTFWNQDILKGHRLGIPAQRSGQVLFYNQGWAQELGFSSAPETPEELKAQACAASQAVAKEKNPQTQGTGGWLVDFDALTTLSWMVANGSTSIPSSEDLGYSFNTPATQKAFAYIHDLYDHGCAWIGKDPTPYTYFAQRQALFYSSDLQDVFEQSKNSPKDIWTVIPFPVTAGNKPVFLVSGLSYGIFHASKEQQLAAWLFARWMMLPVNQAHLIEASGSLPLSSSTVGQLTDFSKKYPQWQTILHWLPVAQSAPNLATWRLVRPVLEDAAWQSLQYNITADKIPTILQQLDSYSAEVIRKSHE
jgi:multiple sugar transport system substrate-binding protein